MNDKNLHINQQITGNYPEPDVPADEAWDSMNKMLDDQDSSPPGGGSGNGFRRRFFYLFSAVTFILIFWIVIGKRKPVIQQQRQNISSDKQKNASSGKKEITPEDQKIKNPDRDNTGMQNESSVATKDNTAQKDKTIFYDSVTNNKNKEDYRYSDSKDLKNKNIKGEVLSADNLNTSLASHNKKSYKPGKNNSDDLSLKQTENSHPKKSSQNLKETPALKNERSIIVTDKTAGDSQKNLLNTNNAETAQVKKKNHRRKNTITNSFPETNDVTINTSSINLSDAGLKENKNNAGKNSKKNKTGNINNSVATSSYINKGNIGYSPGVSQLHADAPAVNRIPDSPVSMNTVRTGTSIINALIENGKNQVTKSREANKLLSDSLALYKTAKNITSSKRRSPSAIHYGLQWNINVPLADTKNYFTGTNGNSQPYTLLIPGVWAGKTFGGRHEVLVQFNFFQQYYLGNRQVDSFTRSLSPLDSTTKILTTKSINKTSGFGAGLQYNYHFAGRWSIGAGITYNWQNRALFTQEIVGISNGKVYSDSLYGAKKSSPDWKYINPSLIIGRIELSYSFQKFQIGSSMLLPLSNLSSYSNNAIRPVNMQLFLRWKF